MSIAAQLAQGSKLYIAGSGATPEILTDVAVGYPTIITITGHDGIANGDVVTLAGFTGVDAATLNGATPVAHHYSTGVTNDSFAVDIDTTGLTITIDVGVTSGTPTDWTQVKELKAIKPSGASSTKIDVTDLDSTAKEYRTGIVDHGTFSSEINVLETDPGQIAVLAAFNASSTNNYKVVTPGKTRTFNATCLKWPTTPDVAVDQVQIGTAEFQISGTVTVS